jgi:diguanylate cyclase (GGDEF)-like protein
MDRAEVYLEHIQKLLRDVKVPPLEGELAENPLAAQIHEKLKTIREILLAFSKGDFSFNITSRDVVSGYLKGIQSYLRHLVWQVQMVEKGNLTQEIHYMGEFSSAFNHMVTKLNQNLGELREKEATLSDKLRNEVKTIETLKESEAHFKFLASHDPLTGILNRRSFIEMTEAGLANAVKLSIPCCIAMMDIDHFKLFNDTYGHLAGDEVLRHVVRTIEAGLRKKDFMGRYGGEEFIFFLNGADEKTGFRALERIRTKLAATPVALESGPVSVYASFGLVEVTLDNLGNTNDVQRLINDADTALYAAKKAGRNRVMLYDSGQETRRQAISPVTQETSEITLSEGEVKSL